MASLHQKIESLLFIATHPLNVKKVAELTDSEPAKTEAALEELRLSYKQNSGGVIIIKNGHEYQMATSPDCAKLVEEYVRKEETGELTRPQLETLTVILYRGPITKPELDQIRGVNSSLILRNLMIRGLVEAHEDKKIETISYAATMDFLKFLGISSVGDLPDYERLNGSKAIDALLNQMKKVEEQKAAGKEEASG